MLNFLCRSALTCLSFCHMFEHDCTISGSVMMKKLSTSYYAPFASIASCWQCYHNAVTNHNFYLRVSKEINGIFKNKHSLPLPDTSMISDKFYQKLKNRSLSFPTRFDHFLETLTYYEENIWFWSKIDVVYSRKEKSIGQLLDELWTI